MPSIPRQPYADAVGSQSNAEQEPDQEQHAHIGSDPDLPVFMRAENPTDCLLPNRTSHLLQTIPDVFIDRQGKRAQHELLVILSRH